MGKGNIDIYDKKHQKYKKQCQPQNAINSQDLHIFNELSIYVDIRKR